MPSIPRGLLHAGAHTRHLDHWPLSQASPLSHVRGTSHGSLRACHSRCISGEANNITKTKWIRLQYGGCNTMNRFVAGWAWHRVYAPRAGRPRIRIRCCRRAAGARRTRPVWRCFPAGLSISSIVRIDRGIALSRRYAGGVATTHGGDFTGGSEAS